VSGIERCPNGQGPKYAWLQTEKGKAYTKRHNQATGAERTARYRERQGDEYRIKHAAEQRLWRSTPEGKRAKKNLALRKRYGITIEQFEELAALQEGVCNICMKTLDMGFHTHVDHCHDTGDVRGILCSGCNVAIGIFSHDPEVLQRAIAYLQKRES
jgi:hypothetical protein